MESFPVTLTLAGHQVKLAHARLQAIKQARDTSPDLIVLDATLPDMDGSTAREILQRLPSTSGIATLLLKPRPQRLMPLSPPVEGVCGGATPSLNPSELLLEVANTFTLCRQLDLEQRDLQQAV